MKLSLFLFLLLSTFGWSQKPTDINDYGFKGKVKSVRSNVYSNFSKIEDTNANFNYYDSIYLDEIRVLTFSDSGNFISIFLEEYTVEDEKDTIIRSRTFFKDMKRGRISVTYDELGKRTSVTTFPKSNKRYPYTIQNQDDDSFRRTSYFKTTKKFRDKKGAITTYDYDDEIVSELKYKNKVNRKGEFVSSRFRDKTLDEKYKIHYKWLEKDSNGNATIVEEYKNKETVPFRVSKRSFDYFGN